ncbi:hypothetical protein JN535_08545 [Cellulosimicrobium cellulans]|uniref:hypothetical protein n=1 Tax=Cellulosimicrobium cellulans TaxID=1710 RepID=UPI0019653C20|nr:hypothetical protein [Cellulosimicrobium cellulans]MBN0040214.1 hypothetical protein [Cellulosimicrobium cellulans]
MSTPEVPVPPPPAPAPQPKRGGARDYIDANRTLLIVIAALAVLLLGASAAWVAQHQVTVNEAQKVLDLRETRDELQARLDDTRQTLEAVSAERDELRGRETDLSVAEANMSTREEGLAPKEEALKEREAAAATKEAELQAREDALKSSESDQWWVPKVAECLARGGSYINASVSVSSFGGDDFSCYTG